MPTAKQPVWFEDIRSALIRGFQILWRDLSYGDEPILVVSTGNELQHVQVRSNETNNTRKLSSTKTNHQVCVIFLCVTSETSIKNNPICYENISPLPSPMSIPMKITPNPIPSELSPDLYLIAQIPRNFTWHPSLLCFHSLAHTTIVAIVMQQHALSFHQSDLCPKTILFYHRPILAYFVHSQIFHCKVKTCSVWAGSMQTS